MNNTLSETAIDRKLEEISKEILDGNLSSKKRAELEELQVYRRNKLILSSPYAARLLLKKRRRLKMPA